MNISTVPRVLPQIMRAGLYMLHMKPAGNSCVPQLPQLSNVLQRLQRNRTDMQRSQSRAASRSELFECDHCSRFTPPVGKPTRFDNLWGQGKHMQTKHPEVRACFSCFSCSASPHNHVCRNMKWLRGSESDTVVAAVGSRGLPAMTLPPRWSSTSMTKSPR